MNKPQIKHDKESINNRLKDFLAANLDSMNK